ncbi:histidine triad nucleotide-binding protein [Brevibacillus reuszeri]|uniref:HIT-like protein n=1 Tax=Brevibacillus reuszeri TaxID=54915 RepID=A0A0K9Z0T6_9BACL|nr:histidine triad nucleotide-binding protein [Brevibacillus reuszeri]KNB74080.1 HIT-like protein [Brevibacillus reuszeri]MED1861664.1 histidine triad nucleotide-binding protein [Brevibacillus reuszeri]GED72824.1 histidine triad nucleotide-binding protein [Brevibacillus reuszeri]
MEKSIFTRIMEGEIPAKVEYEDEQVIVIHDIAPKARVHLLIIPRKPIPTLMDVTPEDLPLIGHIHQVAQTLAKKLEVPGFRLINNCGKEGGQEVFHIHYHFLAGFTE